MLAICTIPQILNKQGACLPGSDDLLGTSTSNAGMLIGARKYILYGTRHVHTIYSTVQATDKNVSRLFVLNVGLLPHPL